MHEKAESMNRKLTYCKILGTNINVTSMQDTLDYLEHNLENLKGNYICVSNVHTTIMAWENEDYKKIQNGGAMALPDGKPLSLVCRKRGFLNARQVAGPNLMPEVFKISEETGYTHYFYGSTSENLQKLQENLKIRFPKLQIVGMYSPPFRTLTEEEDKAVIAEINCQMPDFVWVGLGAPKQEEWMYNHQGKIRGLMIGVGAGFDFHAGTVKRAPIWIQQLYLEWFYRLLQDPRRLWKRYVTTNFKFIRLVVKENRDIRKDK